MGGEGTLSKPRQDKVAKTTRRTTDQISSWWQRMCPELQFLHPKANKGHEWLDEYEISSDQMV